MQLAVNEVFMLEGELFAWSFEQIIKLVSFFPALDEWFSCVIVNYGYYVVAEKQMDRFIRCGYHMF